MYFITIHEKVYFYTSYVNFKKRNFFFFFFFFFNSLHNETLHSLSDSIASHDSCRSKQRNDFVLR